MSIKQRSKAKKSNKLFIRLLLISAIIISAAFILTYNYYQRIFSPNVNITEEATYFHIPTGSDFEDVYIALEESGLVNNINSFKWVAEKKSYPGNIKPGRYKIKNNLNNNELVNLLRSGNQTPVKVTFNNIRTMEELAGSVSRYLECDSTDLLVRLSDKKLISSLGFNKTTLPAMFIPDTYELWWNTTAKDFVLRMHTEYNKFWSKERIKMAEQAGLTSIEVSTLASIVDEETIKEDEKPRVAGLYLNRLNKGIRLQADPTIKYALGDFSIQRVLNKDLQIDSPYNTYKNTGLPPGPIRISSISGINSVLKHEKHKYLYMCAKEDFSGYHNFAKTLRQHNINAAKFHRALRENRIFR